MDLCDKGYLCFHRVATLAVSPLKSVIVDRCSPAHLDKESLTKKQLRFYRYAVDAEKDLPSNLFHVSGANQVAGSFDRYSLFRYKVYFFLEDLTPTEDNNNSLRNFLGLSKVCIRYWAYKDGDLLMTPSWIETALDLLKDLLLADSAKKLFSQVGILDRNGL